MNFILLILFIEYKGTKSLFFIILNDNNIIKLDNTPFYFNFFVLFYNMK